jgi:hypothetical protein
MENNTLCYYDLRKSNNIFWVDGTIEQGRLFVYFYDAIVSYFYDWLDKTSDRSLLKKDIAKDVKFKINEKRTGILYSCLPVNMERDDDDTNDNPWCLELCFDVCSIGVLDGEKIGLMFEFE